MICSSQFLLMLSIPSLLVWCVTMLSSFLSSFSRIPGNHFLWILFMPSLLAWCGRRRHPWPTSLLRLALHRRYKPPTQASIPGDFKSSFLRNKMKWEIQWIPILTKSVITEFLNFWTFISLKPIFLNKDITIKGDKILFFLGPLNFAE